MTLQQIKQLDLEERKLLIEDVDQDRFMLGLIEDLNIDSNNESSSSEHQNRNSNSDLLDELMKNEMFKRKNGQLFNSKQIEELSKLLSKYPENHKSI